MRTMTPMLRTTLTLIALIIATRCESRRELSIQNRLLKELLDCYGYTTMRPVYNVSHVTTVELRLILTQVIELNERHQTIEVGAWITQRWVDEYMKWFPDDYGGIDHLYVHKSMTWRPDTTLYKNVDRDFESYKDIAFHVDSNGVVTWTVPAILKTTCRIDAALFPFDTQVCELRFASWAYDITQLNLTQYQEYTRQSFYNDVGVWELINVTVAREETPYENGQVFVDLSYLIYLRRRPLYHVLAIILPCVLLSLLNLMVFVLPPESGEKISLGMTNLLSLILFQQLISGTLPPTADNAPIIGYYFTPMIALSCTSIVLTVAVLSLYNRDNHHPVPRWIQYVVFNVLSKVVCHRVQSKFQRNTARSGRYEVEFRTREETSCDMADLSGTSTTVDAGEMMPSKSSYRRVGDWEDVTHQQLCAAGLSKTHDSSATTARRGAGGKAESRREYHQTKRLPRVHTHSWQEVAIVIDRTALVLSSVITLSSMVSTTVWFIVRFHST